MAESVPKSGKARMWCFTLHADEDAGEHLAWPVATVRDPPLHWADKVDFRYCFYQVHFLLCINDRVQRVALGGARAGHGEDSSTRLRVPLEASPAERPQEEHKR